MSTTRRTGGIVLLLGMIVFAAFPLFGVFITALHEPGVAPPGLSLPANPQWGNFVDAWQLGNIPVLLRSSSLIALGVVPAGLLIATMAGFALGHLQVPGHRIAFIVIIAGLVVPFESAIVAIYDLVRTMGLLGTRWAIILPLVGLLVPFGVFWMRGHFAAIPRELSDAAMVDGASSWQMFFRIHLPLARPAILTLGLLQFMAAWNQYLLAIVLVDDPTKRTMAGALAAFQTEHGNDVVMMCAGSIIMMAPTMIAFIFLQRQFITALLAGAVKG